MTPSYDKRCGELARFFLDDEGLGEIDEEELAQLIQEAIDDYILEIKNA